MTDSSQPQSVHKKRGQVTRGTYGGGTKSEREAVMIETSEGRYVLRRKNGPAFGDTELDRYVGHTIECDGFLVGTTLLAERITRVT